MIRLSEEATTERVRLQAELERGQQSLERLNLELQARSRDKKIEIDGVVRASQPVFAAAGTGVKLLMQEFGGKYVVGLGAGTPPPAAAAPAQQQQVPEAQVSLEGAKDWQTIVVDMLRDLKSPEPLACLRALACSFALADYGAPPLPSVVSKRLLFELLAKDLGEDRVKAFFFACNAAYVAEAPAQAAPASPLN